MEVLKKNSKVLFSILLALAIAVPSIYFISSAKSSKINIHPYSGIGTTADKELNLARYDWSDETNFPVKVRDGAVLFVGLDPYGVALSPYKGEILVGDDLANWKPTVETLPYAFAVMSDTSVSAEDGTNYKYSWYSPSTRQLRYAYGPGNEYNNLILDPSIAKQNYATGVYRQDLTTKFDTSNGQTLTFLKQEWRKLVTPEKQQQSQQLWRYIAGIDGKGVEDRLYGYLGYTSNMLNNMNDLQKWTDEERKQGFISYLDLLMTAYSCTNGSDEAQQYWGNCIDRYITEGTFGAGESAGTRVHVPFNLTIIPGTTVILPKNINTGAESMVAMTSCMDMWEYAYQVQSIYNPNSKAIANQMAGGKSFGEDWYYNTLKTSVEANVGSLNMEPNEFPVTLKPVYSILNNCFRERYNVTDRTMKNTGGTIVNSFTSTFNRDVGKGSILTGLVHVTALPQTLNMTQNTVKGDFKVVWANEDSSYKSLSPTKSNISDSVRFKMNFSVAPSEEAAWSTIASTYKDFRIYVKPKRVSDISVDVKGGGAESRNRSNAERYSPTAGADGIEIKLSSNEFKSIVLGKMPFLQTYDISMLNQSVQQGEMLTLGYDLEVDFAWFTDGVEKGRVKVPMNGYTSLGDTDKAREEKAEKSHYALTVYREEEHTNSIIYSTDPTAYAEVKQGTVQMDANGSIEDYEAMAGVPSTEYLYYASGGSEFILEFELEYVEGEKGVRWYQSQFAGTECEFKHNDQFKPITGKGKTDENGITQELTILKDKFVADDEDKDYPEPIEVEDEVYDGYIPGGASSYSIDLNGHPDDPKGLDVIGNGYMEDSKPIEATWTGIIENPQGTKNEKATSSTHIKDYDKGDVKPTEHGGYVGNPGVFGETDTKWDVKAYHTAVDQALNWAKAYEKTNETFTVMKWADSDNYQRVWKIGNAQIEVSFSGGTSNQGSGARPTGTYTTSTLAGAKKDGDLANFGYNFSFTAGTPNTTGVHTPAEAGPPPVAHSDTNGTPTVPSEVNGAGNINYTIKVTFPTSSNGTNKLLAHELCGTCCTHMLRGISDSWAQYSQYDYAQFKSCRVYKIHRSYVDGMEDITFADYSGEDTEEAANHLMASGPIDSYTYFTDKGNASKDPWLANWRDGRKVISAKEQSKRHDGTDTIVGAITQGDPNIFYNIALMNNAQDFPDRRSNNTEVAHGGTGYSYAFEVRQQKLERAGNPVPDTDLTDWPQNSGIIRSSKNASAGRVRYSLVPNLLENVWVEEHSQRGNSSNSSPFMGVNGYMNDLNMSLGQGVGSRSNKCDGAGFWHDLAGYSGKGEKNMYADTSKQPLNPVQVKANGHKKPTVSIKSPDLLGNRPSGGLTPNGNTTDIKSFSVGCLYSDSSWTNEAPGNYDNKWTDDEFYMQTLARPDDRTCADVAIEGTVETAGQYQNKDNNVVKQYYAPTVDWYDHQSEEYYKFRFRRNQTNKMFVISDMLIIQTSTGDQPVMYHWKSQTKRSQQHYDYTNADVEPRMAAVDKFTGNNITFKDDFKNMWYNQKAGDKTKTEDWCTATAMGWGVNNIGQEGKVNVGGYTGNYSEPDNKYSDTGLDLVTFNASDKPGTTHNELWTRFPEGFSTLFDHTADIYDPNDLDVMVGHAYAFLDGFGWGAEWPEYIKGPSYIGADGKEGAFLGCDPKNNKGYEKESKNPDARQGISAVNGGALGRWHWGSIVDASARDPYKSSPNQRLDAAYHSPNAMYNRTGESRMSNVSGLRIVTDMIEQDPTNPNQEYRTGDAYQTYINILDWPKVDDGEMNDGNNKGHWSTPGFNRSEFQETKKSGLAGNIRRQRFFDEKVYRTDEDAKSTVDGLIIDATYSDDHTKVNNIVVQDPISVQNALVVHNEAAEKNGWYSDTRTTDVNTFTKESLDDKKDKLEVCPKDDTCEFKVLNCKYFNDVTYLSLDFNKEHANVDDTGHGTVHNLAYDEATPELKSKMEKDVKLGDFRIVDKLVTKVAVKDNPATPENEALDENKNQVYTYNEIKPFGDSNKQFLEAISEDKGGAKLSIPLDKLGLTKEDMQNHKLSVEFDLYMDTPLKQDGKTYREPTMLVGFNGFGFYLPKIENGEHQKYSFTTGNGVEKYTTLFDTYGSSTRLRLEFDFTKEGATKTKLFYNGREITGFNTENNSNDITPDTIFGGNTSLNIGCWYSSNDFVSRFYLDNLKVTLRAGTAEHTDKCYKEETVYESSTQYLCTTPRIWETKDFASAKPYLWTVPSDGKYKLQAWGANGGGLTTDSTKSSHGGLGGYSSGYVSLKKGEQLMIYPGSSGERTTTGGDYEYFWTLGNSMCGNYDAFNKMYPDIMSNINYINSVTGAQEATGVTLHGVWSTKCPTTFSCPSHSISVAIDNATGLPVRRLGPGSSPVKTSIDFGYTGNVQTFTAPKDGVYTLETWGASGGGDSNQNKGSHKGLGGYGKRDVTLKKGKTIYIYVGGQGVYSGGLGSGGGYNGGGHGGPGGYGGGGMTHISTKQNPATAQLTQTSGGVSTGSQDFNYNNGTQKFVAPEDGDYTLEVWGASGGGWGSHGYTPGGYSKGTVHLAKGETIYVTPGGRGADTTLESGNGFNGGTSYSRYGGSGGATHIAKLSGVLSSLAGNKSSVLIVAGGGGSNGWWGSVGVGGGLSGGDAGSTKPGDESWYQLGGTQTGSGRDGIPGGFGYGGTGYDAGGSGGGGWYGGSGAGRYGTSKYSGGGGGSGYIGGVSNGTTTPGVWNGNGKAKITWNINNQVTTASGTWNPSGTLLVAGGGGGTDDITNEALGTSNDGSGGYGGGDTGGDARADGAFRGDTGATQTTGFMQGVGQSVTTVQDTGGAGAGWYGGKVTNFYNGGAGGGSGYPAGYTTPNVNDGNGKARITYVNESNAETWGGAGFNGGGSAGAFGYGGGGASDIRKVTSGGEFKLGTQKPSEAITNYNGVNYIKVFDHDTSKGGFFTSGTEALSCNTPGKFSRLNELDALKAPGKYQFMLYYPETGKRNIWKQSKNPTQEFLPYTDAGIKTSGYEPIQIEMPGDYFGGLALSTPNGGGATYLDGSTGHGNWFYAIGSYRNWPDNSPTTFPGGGGVNVTKAQLYIACNDSLAQSDAKDAVMLDNGNFTYGPYLNAQPGTYQVDIYGKGLSDCTFDICWDFGRTTIPQSQLKDLKVSPTHVSYYFTLDKPISTTGGGLEVRALHEDAPGYKLDSVYVSRLEDRLLVAGGGGGADNGQDQAGGGTDDGSGGFGGELTAENAKVNGKYVVAGQALTEWGVAPGSKLQASIDKIKDPRTGAWKALEGINFSGCGLGAGQDFGYGLGRGESVSYNTDTGGAGGGYYGGYVTNHGNGGAGGGSNFISQSLSDTYQEGANNPGQGRVMIQLIEHEMSQGNTQLFGFQPKTGLANQPHQGSTEIVGQVQEWTVPETGEYKLEVWGASGGDGRRYNSPNIIANTGGKGGYSSAYVTLQAGTKLYIYVGGQGNTNSQREAGTYGAGGWNGGGNGGTCSTEYDPESGAGGGGMTHISLLNGDNVDANVLNRDKAIVVAGGGGGAGSYAGLQQASSGGEGGGTWGYSYSQYNKPGTQLSNSGSGQARGADGWSGGATNPSNRDGSGGNGAGWYGGGRPTTLPPTDYEAGAGGSGYINANLTTHTDNGVFPVVAGQILSGRDIQPKPLALTIGVDATGNYVQTGNTGNGAARITRIERGHDASCKTEVTQGEHPANVHEHKKECLLGPSKANYYAEDELKEVGGKGPGTTGKLEGAIRQYVAGNHKPLEMLLSVNVADRVGPQLAGFVSSNNISGAVDLIEPYIPDIPYDSEVFMCNNYPLNTFDEALAKKVTQRVLVCTEPHHTGGHYQTDKQAIEATGNPDAKSCYDPCCNDANHKKTPQGAHVDASTVKGDTYINTDEYFDLYFPTTGDFYESRDHGIPYTQQEKGIGYTDNMDTAPWIRERYVKFDFDVLFYRTETGLWEQYRANEWIELPVKNGHDDEATQHYPNDQYANKDRQIQDKNGNTINTKKEDWYSFYCTLNNNEKGAATITFEAEAINAPNTKGKYYPRDKYPVLGNNGVQKESLSEKFFRYKANEAHPGEVFGNDYTYRKIFDRESLVDKEWIDFPFMVWKENATGDWYKNTEHNRDSVGFKGGGSTYLVREQNRYNRVLGPTKDNKYDENPATNHRNDNDNKDTVTNERRKGNLTALHGAHLVQTTDLVGRVGNFMITNTTDVRFANFFKVPKDDGTYLINGIVKDIFEGHQRNYFSWHLNGVADNREGLARDVRNRWVGRTTADDPGFNWLYDTWKTQYWKSARASKDGTNNEPIYEPTNGARLDKTTPATEPNLGTGKDKMKYGPLSTPISSDKNNLAVYRDKELLKPGYTVNYEITTTGNYTNKLQVKPYFYALSLSNKNDYPIGTIVPVDVYMLTDKEYKPINLWGYEDVTADGKQKFPAPGMEIYDYMLSLNWKDEKTQRMITEREDQLSTLVHKTMFESVSNGLGTSTGNDEDFKLQPVAIPNGDFFKLGNLQLQRVYNSARTFIGQNLTSYENFVYDRSKETNRDEVDLSDTNFEDKFDLEDYAYRAQRWHLKLGLPSSAVFTIYNGTDRIQPTDEVYAKVNGDDVTWGKVKDTDEGDNTKQKVLGMDVIKNGDYAILMTANIRALGPIWNLYYSQYENNGTVDIKGKRYSFTTDNFLKFTNPELFNDHGDRISDDLSNSQVLIAVYNGSDTSSLDVDMIGTH